MWADRRRRLRWRADRVVPGSRGCCAAGSAELSARSELSTTRRTEHRLFASFRTRPLFGLPQTIALPTLQLNGQTQRSVRVRRPAGTHGRDGAPFSPPCQVAANRGKNRPLRLQVRSEERWNPFTRTSRRACDATVYSFSQAAPPSCSLSRPSRTTMRWAWDGGRMFPDQRCGVRIWAQTHGTTRSCRAGSTRSTRVCPRHRRGRAAPHAGPRRDIGDALGIVIGGDSTLRQEDRDSGHRRARRAQCSTPCGQYSYPICVVGTPGSLGAWPSGPKCTRE